MPSSPPRVPPVSVRAWRFGVSFSLLLVALVLSGTCSAARAAGADWQLLWANRVDEARAAFEARLAAAPADLDARRGLVLALIARGHERAALAELMKQADLPGAGVADFLLADWLDQFVSTSGADDRSLQTLFQRLADRPELDPLDRRAIQAQALGKAILNGDVKSAERLAGALNRLTVWSLLGPFDNVSGSALTRDDLGGQEITLDRKYRGRGRLQVAWFQAPYLDLARQVNVASHFPLGRDLAAYAGLALQVYQPGTFLLSVARSGALSLRLDGQALLSLDDAADQEEFDQFEVQLAAGRHTLLAKICQEGLDGSLAVGLSTLGGQAAGGVGVVPLAPGALEGGPVTFVRRRLPFLETLEQGVRADSLDAGLAFEQLLALHHYLPRHEAREFALAVLRRFPDSALHRVAALRLLARLGDRDQLRQRINRALETDAANAPALLMGAEDALGRKLFSRADSLLTTVIARAPDCLSARLLQLATYRDRGMAAEARALAEELTREAPDFALPYEVLSDSYQALGEKSKARGYSKDAAARLPRSSASLSRLLRAARQEDASGQATSLEELFRIYRDSAWLRTALAEAWLMNGNSNEGLKLADETALKFPYSPQAQLLKAGLEDLRTTYGGGAVNTALDYFARAQLLEPGNIFARDRVRQIKGLKPIKEILPATDLAKVREAAPDPSRYAGAGAVILLDERRRIVLEDGTSYKERALAVKLLTQDGVEAFGSLPLDANPFQSDLAVATAQTVKPDGTVIEAEQGTGQVAFKSLAPGDVIELQYGASAWSDPTLGSEFWDGHGFQWAYPCVESRYTLLVAGGRQVESKLHNPRATPVEPEVSTADGFERHSWVMKDIPGSPREPFAPGWRDATPWLDVSTVGSWDDIARWYAGLSDGPSRTDPRVEARARQLTVADISRDAQLRRLFDFVTNAVTYENLDFQYSALVPASAPSVLEALYGDCKDKVCLLRSMLAAVDIPSWFVLVTPNSEGVAAFLPSPRFTHAILAVESAPGRLTFMDPTARGTPFGALPRLLEGCRALVVRPGELDLTELSSGGAGGTQIRTEMTLPSDRLVAVKRHEVYRAPDDVAGLRAQLADEGESGRRGILAAELGASLVGLKLKTCDWSGLSGPADSVVLGYDAEASPPVTASGSMRILRLPWRSRLSARAGSVIGAAERTTPLNMFLLQTDEEERLNLRLPVGWSLAGVPDPLKLATPFGSVDIAFTLEKGGLRGRRSLRLNGGTVPPEQYPQLREFLGEVVKGLDISLVLQAPATR